MADGVIPLSSLLSPLSLQRRPTGAGSRGRNQSRESRSCGFTFRKASRLAAGLRFLPKKRNLEASEPHLHASGLAPRSSTPFQDEKGSQVLVDLHAGRSSGKSTSELKVIRISPGKEFTMNHRHAIVLLTGYVLFHSTAIAASSKAADPNLNPQAPVQFDLPSIAAAVESADAPGSVTIELRLSAMILSSETPPIDEWLVRLQPRDRSLWIVDYAPRTETASELATPIQVKNTTENNNGMGIGLDGSYGHLVRVNAAADHSKKQQETIQFDRLAPVQAVTAAGTINRGRGVYFKLRWTTQQILEGEKTFRITLGVPEHWRGSLLDVSVLAKGERKSFGWERETVMLGAANFVVAAYRNHDAEAESLARSLADAEFALRSLAAAHRARQRDSLSSMLRHVAAKFDLEDDSRQQGDWLRRLLLDRADPHLDKQIKRLPMPLRVAILEYVDLRDAFVGLSESAPESAPAPNS